MRSQLFRNVGRCYTSIRTNTKIMNYLISRRKPWTPGYQEYKELIIGHILKDQDLIDRFLHNKALPPRYGFRIDERIVEYPWVLARLGVLERLLLDAGSSLNYRYILDLPSLKSRSVVIYGLSQENVIRRNNVAYIYGDLRHTSFDSECFDEIVCISTLEHVGMNNTYLYSSNPRFNEFRPDDYQDVVKEFKRVLKHNGRLFITVPYGRKENHGWLQQFDHRNIEKVIAVFDGSTSSIVYYKYLGNGWQVTDARACDDCSYFDIHKRSEYESDYVAAARCVACIEMVK